MGERLLTHLHRIRQSAPCLGEVRGRGLMTGAEIVEVSGVADHLGARPAASRRAAFKPSACGAA